MKVIVCIKQVPSTEAKVEIDPEKGTLKREGVESIVNPFDLYAIEEGLRLKEKYGGKVAVITMGPEQAKDALKEALAMGADEAYLLSDKAFAGSDTLATAYTLSLAIRKLGEFDLVLCGKQAIDGDTAQVGPGIARRLGISQITYVSKIREVDLERKKIVAERLLEGGTQVVEANLPALLTVVKDINQPRLPSLLGIRKASRTQIPLWGASDLGADPKTVGLSGSPTQVVKVFTPPPRSGGEIIQGEVGEVVPKLAEKLLALKLF